MRPAVSRSAFGNGRNFDALLRHLTKALNKRRRMPRDIVQMVRDYAYPDMVTLLGAAPELGIEALPWAKRLVPCACCPRESNKLWFAEPAQVRVEFEYCFACRADVDRVGLGLGEFGAFLMAACGDCLSQQGLTMRCTRDPNVASRLVDDWLLSVVVSMDSDHLLQYVLCPAQFRATQDDPACAAMWQRRRRRQNHRDSSSTSLWDDTLLFG